MLLRSKLYPSFRRKKSDLCPSTPRKKFGSRLNKLHKCPTLDEFRIYFDLGRSCQNEIDKWVEYALSRGVQRLELNLLRCGKNLQTYEKCYVFPDQLLNLSTGTSVRLPYSDHGGIQFPAFVDFKPIKALSLKSVNVTSEAIEFFLLNCPFLERLEVVGSAHLVNLVVSGPSLKLKYLEIADCWNVRSIIISNSNIVSLKLSKITDLTLNDLPMLTEVGIQDSTPNFPTDIFSRFSFCFSQLEVLALCNNIPQKTLYLGMFPELRKLRRLDIKVRAYAEQTLMGLTSLINVCPNLQKLVLELHVVPSTRPQWELYLKPVRPSLKCLKLIEASGYSGWPTEDNSSSILSRMQ